MLLTLKPPSHTAFPSPPHAQTSPLRTSNNLSPPPPSVNGALPPLPDPRGADRMSTQHRGLPLPPALSLQDRDRPPPPGPPPPPTLTQPMGNLPAPPNQWQGADESMRNWLMAKAEEDKRKQEEEKTRQETLRLEQRRIEQTMLRESLQGGVPPPMVPIVFAGMGGNNLTSTSLEWAQHYMAQITLQQQQQAQQLQPPPPPPPPPPQQQPPPPQQQQLPPSQSSPGLARDRSMTGPQPNPYSTQQPPPAYAPQYQTMGRPGNPGAPPTSNPRGQSGLARLNTEPAAGHHPQPTPAASAHAEQSSPSIYFHHWVPPNSHKDPPASATKSQHSSPYQQHAPSHLRSEYAHSPKRRKTTVSSQTSTQPAKSPDVSPRMATDASAARRRQPSAPHSDGSSRGAAGASRPASRHHGSDTDNGAERSQRRGSSPPATRRDSGGGPDPNAQRSGTPKREAEGPP